MKIHLLFSLCCILVILCAKVSFTESRIIYSIKIVKSKPQMTTNPPSIRVLNDPDAWEIIDENAQWQGENQWEIYFNIATKQEEPIMPRIEISVQGVFPSRVIVGNTDVVYEYRERDGIIRFQLVDDRSVGQLIETYWKDPRGGLPIYLRHNWEIRKVGPWEPWPKNAIHAVNNFLFAAREALRLMERHNPSQERFEGRIVLMGFETSSSRGHVDHPPHLHIMLYVPGYTPGSCVPHLYVNDEGRVYSNSYVKLGVPGSGRKFGPGEICSMEDLDGRIGLEIMITKEGGLMLRAGPGEKPYYLRPHEKGGHLGVSVSQGDEHVCDVSTSDAPSSGEMKATIKYADKTYIEEIHYDPFTGRLLTGRLLVQE